MFDIVIEKDLVNEKLLQSAMLPWAGKDNLGTLGIKGNIERSIALAKVRKVFARKMNLDPDKIGEVSYRAKQLNKLNA